MSQNNQYQQFSKDDFINDEYFQDWVFTDDSDIDIFWKNFIERHPHSREIISEAREILETVPFKQGLGEEKPSDEQVQKSLLRVREILGFKNAGNTKGSAKIISMKYWAAAASIVVLVLAGFYFLQPAPTRMISQNNVIPSKPVNDIDPGGNKAILTLADGTQFVLDSANNGAISKQGNVTVIKLDDGKVGYQLAEDGGQLTGGSGQGAEGRGEGAGLYNTISTPNGGQYQLALSDGSQVWLNAASSLRFPATFSGKERKVELTGEGYFEIAKNEKMPFIVKKNEVEIKVLGTHFNVNAYDDENAMKVTLLEGSVKVMKGKEAVNLAPGQQAKINDGSIALNKEVNIEAVMAWKNGNFVFERADIQTVMRQISRWYDVDVEYKGKVTEQFGGMISRDVNASQVFKMLEMTEGVNFKIEGKKVIVMP